MNRPYGIVVAVVLLAWGSATMAQSNNNYTLEESVLNSGGHPADGTILSNAKHSITLDSLGEGIMGRNLSGNSYTVSGGFIPAYPPPGEVPGLRFTTNSRVAWDAHPAAGLYNLHRGRLRDLPGPDYGACLEQGIDRLFANVPETLPQGDGYFYLVTVENRLGVEGPAGWDSAGGERLVSITCP